MKTTFKLLLASCILFLTVGCHDELVEPAQATEDMKTSATLWEDQFLTMKITTTFDTDIEFYLAGTGTVSVDWGDGTTQSYSLSEGYSQLYHQYPGEQDYTINISGDIESITTFDMAYEELKFNHFHFGGLVNLKELSFHLFAYGPKVINVSRNKALKTINLVGMQGMEDLVLASTNVITHIDLAGENNMSTSVVDRVIARIHDSVVNNPRPGFFNLSESWVPSEEEPNAMIGPPSSYSINKLAKLRGYGWTVTPEPN